MQGTNYNVKTYDKNGELVSDKDFKSIMEISRVYKDQISYQNIYYLLNHKESNRKPSKKIAHIMSRFKVTNCNDNFDFTSE
jgi:hypothetical protein